MATYTRYVDPNADPGGDGTTTALTSVDGTHAYDSIAAWEVGEQALYTAGDIAIADCRRTGTTVDVEPVVIDGWTSGVIPKVIANVDHRHNGSLTGTGYDLATAGNNHGILASIPGTVIDGLRIKGNTSQAYKNGIVVTANDCNNGVISNNIVYDWGSTGTNWNSAIIVSGGNDTFEDGLLFNNIVIAADITLGARASGGIQVYTPYDSCGIFNNTVYGFAGSSNFGIQVGGFSGNETGIVKNNVSVNNTTDFITTYADATSDYNVSSDTTAPGTNVATGKTAYADYFVDHVNGDFSLKGNSTTLFGLAGTDLSSFFTTDITGATRDAWDFGAFEYVASGGITGYLTDTLSMSDAQSPRAAYISSLVDSLGLGEAQSPRAAYISSLVDSLSFADTTAGIAGLIASLTDSLNLTGDESASTLASGVLSDTLNLSDSVSSVATLFSLLSDSITLSDAVAGLLSAKASLTDILSVTDTRGGIGNLIASLIDQLAFVDQVVGSKATATGELTDTLGLADSVSAAGHYRVTVNDSINLSDAATGIAKYLQTIADILHLSDVVSAQAATDVINGPVSVSVTVLNATVTYDILQPTVTYTLE